MSILNHLAQAAAVLLLVELLVVVLVFAGIAGGLAFGLRFVRGKSVPVFDKVNGALPLVRKYTQTGTDLAAKPFITGSGLVATIRGTIQSLELRIRASRTPPYAAAPPRTSPAEPVLPNEGTPPDPLV
ncbi:MAG: hypothetical protein ACRDFX_03975 [Chloroflexota bacterium]